jgi:preprotein translocase subunit SecF
MPSPRHNVLSRLFRGETSFDFAGRWKRWFIASGLIIIIGWASVGFQGINFSIDFKGGTSWEVPTNASVTEAKNAISGIGGASSALRQATVTQLTNRETGKKTIEVEASAKETSNAAEVAKVTDALAKMANTSTNNVALDDIGPTWGSDITDKAIEAVIIFLIIVSIFIWVFFEGKMAVAALTALLHDILITIGLYSLSRFQVSPDTVIAFLTILGYSLYDTIVVFDRVRENTKGLAATGRLTYTDTVNLSMNQVLARSINTSFVAIIPILSILVIGAGILGASTLSDFGLALFIGLTTGAYSSIFIASPLLGLLKEREPRYREIRRRIANLPSGAKAASRAGAGSGTGSGGGSGSPTGPRRRPAPAPARSAGPAVEPDREAPAGTEAPPTAVFNVRTGPPAPAPAQPASSQPAPRPASRSTPRAAPATGTGASPAAKDGDGDAPSSTPVPPRAINRPPPRPRKKTRRR